MNLVCNMGHTVRELGEVRFQRAIGVAAIAPAVVKNHILVAAVAETELDHTLGGAEEEVLRDIATKSIPVVPTDVRRSARVLERWHARCMTYQPI